MLFDLGKRNNQPHWLKISVDSQQSKAAVLQNCSKLIGKEGPQHLAKVFITLDMMPKERESNKISRTKLSKLNKSGKNCQIKSRRIMQRNVLTSLMIILRSLKMCLAVTCLLLCAFY